jgi:hypothetical protein
LKSYPVLSQPRTLSGQPDLDILEVEPYGMQLVNDIRRWLHQQPTREILVLDFQGIRAITASLAMEAGPVLMQIVARLPALGQRYPVYKLDNPEHMYTFAFVFTAMQWAGLAMLEPQTERTPMITPLAGDSLTTTAVLGTLTAQMERILLFADELVKQGKYLTSEQLATLDFQTNVTVAARSKRLTELYDRRLLGLIEKQGHERLFVPAWRLEDPQIQAHQLS